jgi:hypothetical protein
MLLLIMFLLVPFSNANSQWHYVYRMSPDMNSLDANIDDNIVISFVPYVFLSSVNTNTVKVYGSLTGKYPISISLNWPDVKATIIPEWHLKPGERITVSMKGIYNDYEQVIMQPYSFSFKVKPANGTGQFPNSASYPACEGSILSIVPGDFDRDMDLDLSIISEAGGSKLTTLNNAGGGNFSSALSVLSIPPRANWYLPYFHFTGDYDSDYDLDIAILNWSGSVNSTLSIYKNDSFGRFVLSSSTTVNRAFYDVDQGDMDGDGDLDFAIMSGNRIGFLLNNGNGEFGYQYQYFELGGCYYQLGGTISVADLDNDGDQDVYNVVRTREEEPGICWETNVFANNGEGSYSRNLIQPPVNTVIYSINDMNNDRKLDLIASPRILFNQSIISYTLGTFPSQSYYVLTEDFDSDEDLDIADPLGAGTPPDVHFNDGSGVFTGVISSMQESFPVTFCAGDFDGDGDVDVMKSGVQDGYVTLYKNYGNCLIEGPGVINIDSTMIRFNCSETQGYWTVLNNPPCSAYISGENDNDTVYINAGSTAGSFVLSFFLPDSIESCSRIISVDNPYPVELSSFTYLVTERNVMLSWTTSAELNNSGFDIERKDAFISTQTEWKYLANVRSAGSSEIPMSYSYEDRNLPTGSYLYRLKQIDFNGNFEYFELPEAVTIGLPDKFFVEQNYPNPFNPATTIAFGIPEAGNVKLKIFDITGKEIKTLLNEYRDAGYYTAKFDASGLASGVYVYRLAVSPSNPIESGNYVSVKKMLFLK